MRFWRVYYSDGSTYDASRPVEDAPGDGVLVIVQADQDPVDQPYTLGRESLFGKDFYWFERGRWFGGDVYGRDDYMRRPGWRKTVAGRTVTHAEFHAVKARADADVDFPRATAEPTR